VTRGLISYSSFDRKIDAIRFNQDVAIVMGSETVVRKGELAAGSTQPIHRRYTTVWRKSGATWQAIARHANVIAPGTTPPARP
jgi:ketosteroid isomerase-like protein